LIGKDPGKKGSGFSGKPGLFSDGGFGIHESLQQWQFQSREDRGFGT
jgi:hypothetical protein